MPARDSKPRPPNYKACALPLSYYRDPIQIKIYQQHEASIDVTPPSELYYKFIKVIKNFVQPFFVPSLRMA